MSSRLAGYAKLTGHTMVPPFDGLTGDHATQKVPLGTVIKDVMGNSFRYVKANEALTKGDVVTAVAKAAWDSGIVTDGAVVAADTKIHIDTITTAMTKNQYAGYFVSQATAAGKGRGIQIIAHDAMAASGEGDLIVESAEVIADGVALLIYNPFVVELTDAATEPIMGVVAGDITSGQFGWIQTNGHCPVVKVGHTTSAAVVLNEPLLPVAANPGAVQGFAGTGEPDIVEAALTKLVALQAVASDTPGFLEAYIIGQ